MEKILLIDLGHLSHRYLFTNAPDIKVAGYGLLRYRLCNAIFSYISQFKPTKVYIGVDYKKSWRKVISTFYKEKREENREKSADIIEWKDFYNFMDSFVNELQATFPFYVPLIPHLEADDVIGYLTKTLPFESEKTIVTGDTDYIQLMKYPNTRIWSSCKNQNKGGFVTDIDPEMALQIKIICGDKSDNIPGCRKGLGPKTAEKLINSGELQKMLDEIDSEGNPSEFRRTYDRNKKLIDMEMVPTQLTDKLQECLNNYKLADGSMLFNYFTQNKLVEMFDHIDKYRHMIKPLTEHLPKNERKVSLREVVFS
jgi:5'-3' exonuclease